MRAGALDLLLKPINKEQLLESVTRVLADTRLARDARYDRWQAIHGLNFAQIIGNSADLRKALTVMRQVAPTNAQVLIQGESGTGKDLVANAIHALSARRTGPFRAVNAGALPAALLESTLFGSRKGAFTGSVSDQPGYFEAAHGGTLFLDEIGETTAEVQVRLLRVMEEKTVTRLGEVTPRPADARIVAATNRDLRAEVEAKRFRQDLYYRLAVVTITLPPLRERLSDLETLARHFLQKHATDLAKPIGDFDPACFDKLRRYHWPGNIRELDNVIQRAAILTEGRTVDPDLLLLERPAGPAAEVESLLDQELPEATLAFEKLYFARLLARTANNKTRAADIAGIDRTSLYAHLRKLGMSGPKDAP
jgi:DNA-binding NtrC family response regulator